MEVKPDDRNALCPMLVTPAGISMEVKLDALKNALDPMLVTPAGISMEVKLDAL